MVIHWTKGMLAGMGYVMLGRSARKVDLFIYGQLDVKEIRCNPDALKESKRLSSVFDDGVKKENEKRSRCWKISFLNVRSVKAAGGHASDVVRDNFLMDSDVFGLGETWLEDGQKVDIDTFTGHFANFGSGKGVAAYSKIELVAPPKIYATASCSAILLKTTGFHIIFLYLSKDYKKDCLLGLLNDWVEPDTPTAVIGDVNENLMKLKRANFAMMMSQKGFTQMIKEATCETGSLIDHLYINKALKAQNVTTDTNAAYYSDHDILSLYIPKQQ